MRTRILPPEEWGRLDEGLSTVLNSVQDASMIVVEDDTGRIIGTMGVLRMTHFEGLWIAPEHRRGYVLGRLLRGAEGLAREKGETWAIGGAADKDELMDGLIRRRGGSELPLRFYVMPLGVN